MEIGELFSTAPKDWGSWLLIVLIFLTFGAPAVFSEKTAKTNLWAIGKVAHWIQNRKKRQQEAELLLEESKTKAIVNKINALQNQIDEDRQFYAELLQSKDQRYSSEINNLKGLLLEEQQERKKIETRLASELDMATDYIAHVSVWARDVLTTAKAGGWSDGLPKWIPFSEWRESYHKRNGSG